jgi:hypothetical protein
MNDRTITLSFSLEHINIILRHLDAGAHGQVRQLIDLIIAETNAQQQAHMAPAAHAATEVGGTD